MVDWEELIFLLVRWIHVVMAAVWIGGSAFIALVVRPLAAAHPEMSAAYSGIGRRYSDIVSLLVVLLLLSGVLLSLERIYLQSTPPLWFLVLAVKLALAGWTFYIIWHNRRIGWAAGNGSGPVGRIRATISRLLGYNALIALGVIIFFLSSLLRTIFEANS